MFLLTFPATRVIYVVPKIKGGSFMNCISKEALQRIREEYPVGARVELMKMNDPYRTDLVPGCRGTVRFVDDMGTIHVSWDIGSSLGVVYGEDACKIIVK